MSIETNCPVCGIPDGVWRHCANTRCPDKAQLPHVDFYATYRPPRRRDLFAMGMRLLIVLTLLAAAYVVVRAGFALAYVWPV